MKLSKDEEADVVIVGGGIAGISTAFFLLRNTNKNVILLEKWKLAYGATGHNAGQVCSYFEKPFSELAKEFGLAMAVEGQRSIEENAWELLDVIYTESNLSIPFSRFSGYDGLSTYEQVIEVLKENDLRIKGGLKPQEILISGEAKFANNIPSVYENCYRFVSKKEILEKLETRKEDFVALCIEQKGVLNSALFTQEVALHLLSKFPDRFRIFEDTKVGKIVLKEDHALLDTEKHVVKGGRVILCTNGFGNIEIFNKSGLDIDKSFHHSLHGVVGRMSGYLEAPNKPPIAVSYYIEPKEGFADMEDPYFYLTRREYEHEKGSRHNLVCLGGPQHSIPDREEYLFEFDYPEEVPREVDEFIKSLYDIDPNRKIEYIFTWYGLMGYTPNGVRRVGPEPRNPVLMYNLGCNGVGILPSVFAGDKISKIIRGDKFPPSIFDPKEN